MKLKSPSRSRAIRSNGILILAGLLAACSAGPVSSEGGFDSKKGQMEKTAEGRTLVLAWEMGKGDLEACQITLVEKGTSTGELVVVFSPCTPENLLSTVEGWRGKLSASAPTWIGDALDQMVAELGQLK